VDHFSTFFDPEVRNIFHQHRKWPLFSAAGFPLHGRRTPFMRPGANEGARKLPGRDRGRKRKSGSGNNFSFVKRADNCP
jgi:hypothetical protein